MSRKIDKPETLTTMQKKKSGGASSGQGLGREATIKISRQLRAMYDETVKEGVPERFAELLRRMDKENGEGSRS